MQSSHGGLKSLKPGQRIALEEKEVMSPSQRLSSEVSCVQSDYVCHWCLTDEHHKHRNLKGLELKLLLLIKSRAIMMTFSS